MRGLFKLVFKSMGQNRTRALFYFISFLIFTGLSVLLFDVSQSILGQSQRENQKIYGSFSYILYDMNNEYDDAIDSEGVLSIVYQEFMDNDDILCMGYADHTAIALGGLELLNGQLPKNESDIALTASIAEKIGVIINDTVRIDDYDYTVTGIVEDYGRLWPSGENQLSDNAIVINAFISRQRYETLENDYQILLLEADAEGLADSDLLGSYLFFNTNGVVSNSDLFEIPPIFYIIFVLYAFIVSLNLIFLLANKWKNKLNIFYLLGMKRSYIKVYSAAELFLYGLIGISAGALAGHYSARLLLYILNNTSKMNIGFYSNFSMEITIALAMLGLCIYSILIFTYIFFRKKTTRRAAATEKPPKRNRFLRRTFLEFHSSQKTVLAMLVLLGMFSVVLLSCAMSYRNIYEKNTQHVEVDGKMPFDYDFEFYTELRDTVNNALSATEQISFSVDDEVSVFNSNTFERDGVTDLLLQSIRSEKEVYKIHACKENVKSYIILNQGAIDTYLDGSDNILDGHFNGTHDLSEDVRDYFEYDRDDLLVNTRIMGYDDENLEWLSRYVCEGSINIEKLKSGEEIILMVPAYTLTEDESHTIWMKHVDYASVDAINDTNFHVGDTLSLSQLVSDQEINGYLSLTDTAALFERRDYEVKIGAIIRTYAGWFENNAAGPKKAYTLLTSNDAFDILGIPSTYSHVRVYLDNAVKDTEGITAIMKNYLNGFPYLKLICRSNDMRAYRQYNLILNIFVAALFSFCLIASYTVTYSQVLIKTKMNERTYALLQICGDSCRSLIRMLLLQMMIVFFISAAISIPLIIILDKYLQWGLISHVPLALFLVCLSWLIATLPSIFHIKNTNIAEILSKD